MSFLRDIFAQLRATPDMPVLQESGGHSVTGGELLEMVRIARMSLVNSGLKKGDRCALLAHNSVRWIAVDLAIMAEGLIVVLQPTARRRAPMAPDRVRRRRLA